MKRNQGCVSNVQNEFLSSLRFLQALSKRKGRRLFNAALSRLINLTIFADQEVQVAIGVGHAHLGLHLRSLQGGVNLPWTVLL